MHLKVYGGFKGFYKMKGDRGAFNPLTGVRNMQRNVGVDAMCASFFCYRPANITLGASQFGKQRVRRCFAQRHLADLCEGRQPLDLHVSLLNPGIICKTYISPDLNTVTAEKTDIFKKKQKNNICSVFSGLARLTFPL